MNGERVADKAEQEGAGGGKRIQNMDLILAALRRIETETSKVTHDAMNQQKKLDFEGFKMEERLSSYSARHTGMQLHSLKGEKQLLHKYENEGEKYCGTGELVAEANDSEELERQVKQQIQNEAQKQAGEGQRQRKAQDNHRLQLFLAEKESRIEQLQQRLAEAQNELQELTIKQEHEMRALMERLLEVFASWGGSSKCMFKVEVFVSSSSSASQLPSTCQKVRSWI